MVKQEIISKEEALRKFASCEFRNWPIEIKLFHAKNAGADSLAEIRWGAKVYTFAVDYKTNLTPKALDQFLWQRSLQSVNTPETNPLIIAPYLSDSNLQSLEARGVSGMDLNGNGYIVVPGELLVSRSGNPNHFVSPRVTLNPYNGATSLVARTLLLCPEFSTGKEILDEAKRRGGAGLTLGTVSKALPPLEEDLLILREGRTVKLIDKDILLEKLVANFQYPKITRRIKGNCSEKTLNRIFAENGNDNFFLVPNGQWSAQAYAAAARSGVFVMHCSNIERFLEIAGPGSFQEEEFFPDVELLQTTDRTVYFDSRFKGSNGYTWASPIQAYLELMAVADKRDREIAGQVKQAIFIDLCGENKLWA